MPRNPWGRPHSSVRSFNRSYSNIVVTVSVVGVKRVRKDDAYGRVLAGRLSSEEQCRLIRTLCQRAEIPRNSQVARGKSRTNTETGKALFPSDIHAEL
jgi:hypothetical protein